MDHRRRWDPAVAHRGAAVEGFIEAYFGRADRKVLLVAGAGFDPRAQAVALRLVKAGQADIAALLIREIRPEPPRGESDRADANLAALRELWDATKLFQLRSTGAMVRLWVVEMRLECWRYVLLAIVPT